MRILALIPLLLLLNAAAVAETYYKWVDKNGVTHYSDRPREGAQKIEINEVQTYTPPPTPAVSAGTGAQDKNKAARPYNSLDVLRPKNDEVFVNTVNTVPVRISLDPALQPGHSIWIYLDGKRVDGLPTSGTDFQLNEVFRGTHSVNVVITDGRGKPIMQSAGVAFHLRQTSVLNQPRRSATPPRP